LVKLTQYNVESIELKKEMQICKMPAITAKKWAELNRKANIFDAIIRIASYDFIVDRTKRKEEILLIKRKDKTLFILINDQL
jgi:hypothetical protein